MADWAILANPGSVIRDLISSGSYRKISDHGMMGANVSAIVWKNWWLVGYVPRPAKRGADRYVPPPRTAIYLRFASTMEYTGGIQPKACR